MPIRIGAFRWANSLALVSALSRVSGPHEVVWREGPKNLAADMASGLVDVALLPIVEFLQRPNYTLLTAGGIVSHGPVWSVCVFLYRPLATVRRLLLDSRSLTSRLLARIVLESQGPLARSVADWHGPALPSPSETDAFLAIGEPALRLTWQGMPRLDLGEAWTNLTGLPFIYAAWMARPGVPLAEIWHRLNAARCEGTEEIAQNAQEVAAKLNLPPSFIQQYMTQNLEYNITSSALSAVDVFRRSLHRGPKSSVPDSDVQTSQGRIFGLERIASRGKP